MTMRAWGDGLTRCEPGRIDVHELLHLVEIADDVPDEARGPHLGVLPCLWAWDLGGEVEEVECGYEAAVQMHVKWRMVLDVLGRLTERFLAGDVARSGETCP